MLFPWLAVLLWLAMNARLVKGRTPSSFINECLWSAAATVSITLVFYAPALIGSGYQALLANPFIHALPPRMFLWAMLKLAASLWLRWTSGMPAVLWVPLSAALLGSFLLRRRVLRERFPIYLCVLVSIFLVAGAQRAAPYPRSLLFVFALIAIYVGAGLAFALSHFAANPRVTPAIATALCLALASTVITRRTVEYSEDTGTFRDVAVVFRFLTSTMRPGDVVLVLPPLDAPLEYYAQSQGYGLQSGNSGSSDPVRSFAVLNKRLEKGHADGVLDARILSLNGIRELCGVASYDPQSVLETPFSVVYEMRGRLRPASNLCRPFSITRKP